MTGQQQGQRGNANSQQGEKGQQQGGEQGGQKGQQGGQQGQATEGEGDQRGDVGDLGDLPPAVRVQQDGPQGLALEHGGDLAGQLGVVRLGQGGGRQLGVGLAAGHVGDVHGNEVVSVGLGLLAGDQLLPGVLRDRRDHRRGDLGPGLGVRECGLGREEDLLCGQLALHGVVHVGRAPQQHAAGRQQDRCQDESGDRGQTGESNGFDHTSKIARHFVVCMSRYVALLKVVSENRTDSE